MSNIIGLHGSPLLDNGANPDVVELLEDLLAEARRGEILAFAATVLSPNMALASRSPAIHQHRHMLVAGAWYLMRDMTSEVKT